MSSSPTSEALPLDQAGHALRQVLLRLNHYAESQARRSDPATRHGAAALAHLKDLAALLTAVEQYEQLLLVCAPQPVVDWQANPNPTPAKLLAEREQNPLYRLGWVRGYKQGQVIGQRKEKSAPATTGDNQALIQQIRSFLTQLQQRYGARAIA